MSGEQGSQLLFIPHLPPSLVNWQLLKSHFSQFGEVANVILNPQQANCTIQFESEDDAKVAKKRGGVWKGRTFDILYRDEMDNVTNQKRVSPGRSSQASSPVNTRTQLLIPKLPPSLLDWKTLKSHFSQFGEVKKVILNPQLSKCTVQFVTEDAASKAKQNGGTWKGKTFEILYPNETPTTMLDPRALQSPSSYSDIEGMAWDAEVEDVDSFGVSPETRSGDRGRKKREDSPLYRSPTEASRGRNVKTVRKDPNSSERAKTREKALRAKLLAKSKELTTPKPAKGRLAKSVSVSSDESDEHFLKSSHSVSENVTDHLRGFRKDETKESTESHDTERELKEKLDLLNERDQLFRKSQEASSTGSVIVGTCPDMCPEKERIMRQYRRLVSVYECEPQSHRMDPALAVKVYSRSSADQEQPLPHELRPEPVLSMTMAYLINNIIPLIEDSSVNVSDWYNFCWDRLRSIRKDIIQQQLCDLETVNIIEQCARFHIACYDRLWGVSVDVFDKKINTENLLNCLQSLRHMYKDLGENNIQCPNEGEFNAYLILINIKTGDVMTEYQKFSPRILQDNTIKSAIDIYLAYNNRLYSKFFNLIAKTSYLNACLLQRYFSTVRVNALKSIVKAYCPPRNHPGIIPLAEMMQILHFDRKEDVKLFCESHGVLLEDDEFRFFRQDFMLPETEVKVRRSSRLVRGKRVSLQKAVVGENGVIPKYIKHNVHSSFTPDGKIKDMPKYEPKFDSITESSYIEDMASEDIYYNDEVFSDQLSPASPSRHEDELDIQYDIEDEEMEDISDVSGQTSSLFSPKIEVSAVSSQSSTPAEQHSFGSFKIPSFSFSRQPTAFMKQEAISPSSMFTPPTQISDITDSAITSSKRKRRLDSEYNFKAEETSKNEPPVVNQSTNPPQATKRYSHPWGDEIINPPEIVAPSKSHFDILSDKIRNKQISPEETFQNHSVSQNQSSSASGFESDFKFQPPLNVQKHYQQLSLRAGGEIEPHKTNFKSPTSDVIPSQFPRDVVKPKLEESMSKIDDDFVAKDRDDSEKEDDDDNDEDENNEAVESEIIDKNKHQIKDKTDEFVLKKLSADLRKKMKIIGVRKFARQWRNRVERIKERRKDFPFMMYIPTEQHIRRWGVLKSSVLDPIVRRVRDKERSSKIVDSVLMRGLPNHVPYIGQQIAEILVSKLHSIQSKANDLICWKLVVSVPSEKERTFLSDKLTSWMKHMFYQTNESCLGTAKQVNTSLNVSVYYSAHVVVGTAFDSSLLKGFDAVIFFTVDGIENPYEKRNRYNSLVKCREHSSKKFSTVLINVGEGTDDDALIECIEMTSRKMCKEEWIDVSSIVNSVKYLAKNISTTNELSIGCLRRVVERSAEKLFDAMSALKNESTELSKVTTNPNNVILFYNICLELMKVELIKTVDNEQDFFPPEFRKFVKIEDAPDLHFDGYSFSTSHKNNFTNTLKAVMLIYPFHWRPKSYEDIATCLKQYCTSINCQHLFPRIMRLININEEEDLNECLRRIPWLTIVEMWTKHLIIQAKSTQNDVVVIYDEREVTNKIMNKEWWVNVVSGLV